MPTGKPLKKHYDLMSYLYKSWKNKNIMLPFGGYDVRLLG